jgi:isopropylmalate/homocitrate/citramalate synthase
MGDGNVNKEKVFYDFQGKLPSVSLNENPALPPPEGLSTHPKLITDTTLRDGTQDTRFAIFSPEAKLAYYDLLHDLDNGCGRIEAVEVFIYQKRDLWVLDELLSRGYDFPKVTTWTRATPKDIKMMVDATKGRVEETGMLASSSDHHIFDKLGFKSKEEAIERYLRPILTACEHDVTPRVHLEDITKADIHGWVIPFMQRVLKETDGRAKFRACDTLGIGVPDLHAALPLGVPLLISTLVRETGAEVEFHGHNDFGLAAANSMAAFQYGAKRVNTAFGGLGERTGNTPLEQVLANYVRVYGDPGFNLEALGEMSALIAERVVPVPEKQPLIGDVFTTQAGIHQTGIERQKEAEGGLIYLPFEPSQLGRNNVSLNRVGSLSGMDGITAILNEQHRLSGGEDGKYSTASRVVKLIYDKVQEAYDGLFDDEQGRYTGHRTSFFSPEEIYQMARELEAARGQ